MPPFPVVPWFRFREMNADYFVHTALRHEISPGRGTEPDQFADPSAPKKYVVHRSARASATGFPDTATRLRPNHITRVYYRTQFCENNDRIGLNLNTDLIRYNTHRADWGRYRNRNIPAP